ncbi:DUF4191 domain-containing protein [Corynebacterium caspium]|uniref:DUF4191 domain-containing protein n=1 Tax=Corynebacterium caspium TaxID=234828 RepID=UPI000376B4DB|nr:DUF4191 domain-containing protein [Corynebacterium caspium]WKD58955.1 hypothetical protein CCASP_02755 [Corynebacterium caspium DSM 44850]
MADPNKAAAKAAKKEARAAKRASRKQTWSQFWQAFKLQREQDKMLLPIMAAAILVPAIAFFLIGALFHAQWYMLVAGIGLGLLLAMWLFTRRLEKSMYDRVGDTPGAAGWALENMRNSVGIVWFVKVAAAANRNMDVVHRVIGVPGVVLVGEGDMRRLKSIMDRERRRYERLLANVPIFEIYVGDGPEQTPLKKLQRELLKLPRNYKKDAVYPLNAKVEAIDAVAGGNTQGIPKGPLPKGGAQISGMGRRARRASGRNKNS